MNRIILAAFLVPAITGLASGEVIITEIMYNPESSERQPVRTEWVEIYNSSGRTANLAGCYVQDEDGKTTPLPDGAHLDAGKALILIPGEQTTEGFREAWGKEILAVPLDGWGMGGIGGLANSPSETNEILTLRDSRGNVIDEVNYDDSGDWPSDSPDGASIHLNPDALTADANDDGKNWTRSEYGERGVHRNEKTDTFNGTDIGSPGVVIRE